MIKTDIELDDYFINFVKQKYAKQQQQNKTKRKKSKTKQQTKKKKKEENKTIHFDTYKVIHWWFICT